MGYDSTKDTQDHINRVRSLLEIVCTKLQDRAKVHDDSKLGPVEKPLFDEFTPLLKESTYGSDEYKNFLVKMNTALQHHYANNSHHPECFNSGINGMSLLDIIEMICDWKAATERHTNGCLENSIQINKNRFKMSEQLVSIFENTRKELGW